MNRRRRIAGLAVVVLVALSAMNSMVSAGMKTWDGRHSIDRIDVTVVYFVPKDREPLPDWQERVGYFCRRIERFHQREYQGQSVLATTVPDEPFRSTRTTSQLRNGDANFIFFQTLREVDETLKFGPKEGRDAFPILLVLSEINWRPLDDFHRLKPGTDGLEFEGNYSQGRHFPGAASGGARATYLADAGKGWGLVSADGWRVPYSGTDCVVYHEGVGHTVGLPHPEPGNGSVMSMGQYRGWISQSWLDDDQKRRLGWTPGDQDVDRTDLYSVFEALPQPAVPRPGDEVSLKCRWPNGAKIESCRLRIQSAIAGPWVDIPVDVKPGGDAPERLSVGVFDRAAPLSYRIDAWLTDGQNVELWGYFQVRDEDGRDPLPLSLQASADLVQAVTATGREPRYEDTIDLLEGLDPQAGRVSGVWTVDNQGLISPKQFGTRMELPWVAPDEYQLMAVVEPLDEPNGLILGQRSGGNRFLVLVNYVVANDQKLSALENIDGRNVGSNPTTFRGSLLRQNRISQVVCTVRKDSVEVIVDGRRIIRWEGGPEQLGLSDYWQTPNSDRLFIGAYDCRYRIHRLSLTPITGTARPIKELPGKVDDR